MLAMQAPFPSNFSALPHMENVASTTDPRLNVNRVSQQLQRGLVKTLALGRVRMNGRGDILQPRPHLDCETERCR
jgi:hypothetical protein